MAPYGPISGQDEGYHLQEALQAIPGPPGPPNNLKQIWIFCENPGNPGILVSPRRWNGPTLMAFCHMDSIDEQTVRPIVKFGRYVLP